jgi:hypothetical protein
VCPSLCKWLWAHSSHKTQGSLVTTAFHGDWEVDHELLIWPTGSVMVKSPLNRELVATYEVTLSVIDNASDLPERSVSVPNGKVPLLAFLIGHSELLRVGGWRSRSSHRPGPEEGVPRLSPKAPGSQAVHGSWQPQ